MKTKKTATRKLRGNSLFNPAKFMATLTKKLPVRASTAFRIAGVAVTVGLAGFALSAGSSARAPRAVDRSLPGGILPIRRNMESRREPTLVPCRQPI